MEVKMHRYRKYQRRGTWYSFDVQTGKRESLRTKNAKAADKLIGALNETQDQPQLNRSLARVYAQGYDPDAPKRTWRHVFAQAIAMKEGSTKQRWITASKHPPYRHIMDMPLMDTRADDFLHVMRKGSPSTIKHLRQLHNFALGLGWLLAEILPRAYWPKERYRPKRAITFEEHSRIVERELNPERRAFYELCWHLGASQGDVAHLTADAIDWNERVIVFQRRKLKDRPAEPVQISFGEVCAEVLRKLPKEGPLFPYLSSVRPGDRATEFSQRCKGLGITGVTLHSYRYAWAERAMKAGYPERYAMLALGHNSKAMARYYSRRAKFVLPSLESYESKQPNNNIVRIREAA